MNTLTKILIVLLTLSSIFLCGIVATYVSHASNYKQLYEDEQRQSQAAIGKQEYAEQQLDERKKKYQLQENDLKKRVAALTTDIGSLRDELKTLKTEKAGLEQKVESWVTMMKDLTETTDNQQQLFKNTFEELNTVKADQIKEREQLKEITDKLIEKMAIIDTLMAEKRRLEEEKHQLQNQLSQSLQPRPEKVPFVSPVTPKEDIARPVKPAVRDIGLKGLVAAVDLKHGLAQVSIGSAHGVKEGMIFYVTRGREFICEIHIFYVDAENAVGDLKRKKYDPRNGDTVSTNL